MPGAKIKWLFRLHTKKAQEIVRGSFYFDVKSL